MNRAAKFPGRGCGKSDRGVALVLTLMMMSVLVMMVLGLAGVMRNEQAAARNLTYQVVAEQMADLGARQGMAAVLSGSLANLERPPVSGPGWMMVNGVWTPLFVTSTVTGTKNIEEIGTNSLILGLPDGVRGEILVGWTNLAAPGVGTNRPMGRYSFWVDDEGTKVNLNAAGSNNSTAYLPWLTNFPVSADYIFVDPATGVPNTNTSSGEFIRKRNFSRRTNFLFSAESLKDTNATGITGTNSVGTTVYRRAKGHITAWSSNVDLTPWGTAKISLENTNTALTTNQVLTALATNAWTNFFGPDASLARKYGGGSASSTNVGNHGDLVMQQIAANIMAARGTPVLLTNPLRDFQRANPAGSFFRHRNSMPLRVASHYQGPFLEQVRARVDYRISGNAATPLVEGRLGIWVRVANPYATTSTNFSVTVRPRKFRFGLYNRSSNDFSANVAVSGLAFGSPLGGLYGTQADVSTRVWVGPRWEIDPPAQLADSWPLNAGYTNGPFNLEPRSRTDLFFENIISYTVTGAPASDLPPVVKAAYVILDQICLYEGPTTSPTNLRDWLTHDDLGQPGNFRTGLDVGQFDFSKEPGTGMGNTPIAVANFGPLTTNDFTPTTSLGVRRMDPQVRFSLPFWDAGSATSAYSFGLLKTNGWPTNATGPRAWSVNTAFSCTNTDGSVTGIPYLWPDPAPGVTDVFDHPHFVAGYRPTNSIRSVAQLGAIHTGIPWRTLRLGPTSTEELSLGPPDWVVLEVFTATNTLASLPRINPNGLPVGLRGSSPGLATNGLRQSPTRVWSVLSAMASAASPVPATNTAVLASNGVPTSLTTSNAAYSNLATLVGSNLVSALSNPASASGWSFRSGWRNYRTNSSIFPANGFALAGEVLEVAGVADDANLREDVIEGRLRSFQELFTTRSDTFSVWSVGQGLLVVTNAAGTPIRTNIMGEVRKQTVFQRVPQFDSENKLSGYQLRVLYTRNHVVE